MSPHQTSLHLTYRTSAVEGKFQPPNTCHFFTALGCEARYHREPFLSGYSLRALSARFYSFMIHIALSELYMASAPSEPNQQPYIQFNGSYSRTLPNGNTANRPSSPTVNSAMSFWLFVRIKWSGSLVSCIAMLILR